MNDTIAEASPNGAPKVSRINEAVIRIAGNSQDGIQAIGGFLARLAGRSEQEVMTFMTIPSTISGGPSIFQVRIGSGEVLSAGDEADVLLPFYQHSYEDHIGSLKKGGIVLYDSDHVQPKPEWEKDYHHVGVPISSLTVEAIGGTAKDKGKNIYALGLIARMFDLNVPKLEKLIGERFTGKDPSVLNNALAAFHAGYSHSLGNVLETFKFVDSKNKGGHQVVMNGNEALGLRPHRGGRPVWRGLSHHAVDGHHGTAAPRTARNTAVPSSSARMKSPPFPWPSARATPAASRSPAPAGRAFP